MPNPCPPGEENAKYGPYRVQLDLQLPDGWEDENTFNPFTGWPESTVLTDVLKTAFDQHPAPITAEIRGVPTSEVYCGSSPYVGQSQLLDVHSGDDPGPVTWWVEVWQYAPHGLSPEWHDHPHVARLWADTLTEITVPATSTAAGGTAAVSAAAVAYQVNGLYQVRLPDDYPDTPV